MLAAIAVLNVKEPLAETRRLSVPLFSRVMEAPAAKPLTVPPIVKGPVPPPPPPVPPELAGGPLQAASASEIRIMGAKKENFTRDFMAIDCSFDTLLQKRQRIFHALAAFPGLLEKNSCSFRARD